MLWKNSRGCRAPGLPVTAFPAWTSYWDWSARAAQQHLQHGWLPVSCTGDGNKPWIKCGNYRLWPSYEHLLTAQFIPNASQDRWWCDIPLENIPVLRARTLLWAGKWGRSITGWHNVIIISPASCRLKKPPPREPPREFRLNALPVHGEAVADREQVPGSLLPRSWHHCHCPAWPSAFQGGKPWHWRGCCSGRHKQSAERHFLSVSLLGVMNPASHSDLLSGVTVSNPHFGVFCCNRRENTLAFFSRTRRNSSNCNPGRTHMGERKPTSPHTCPAKISKLTFTF